CATLAAPKQRLTAGPERLELFFNRRVRLPASRCGRCRAGLMKSLQPFKLLDANVVCLPKTGHYVPIAIGTDDVRTGVPVFSSAMLILLQARYDVLFQKPLIRRRHAPVRVGEHKMIAYHTFDSCELWQAAVETCFHALARTRGNRDHMPIRQHDI